MTTTPDPANQAQLDILGLARAISDGHKQQAAAVLNQLTCHEKSLMLTAAVVLLTHTLAALAVALGIPPADLYQRVIQAANLETL